MSKNPVWQNCRMFRLCGPRKHSLRLLLSRRPPWYTANKQKPDDLRVGLVSLARSLVSSASWMGCRL